MPPEINFFSDERAENARADLTVLQNLLEQAVGGVRTFGKMYNVRMRIFDLISRALAAVPEENPHVRRFSQLIDKDFAEFCEAEPAVNAHLPLRTLQHIKETMLRIAAFPALHSRRIVAVGGSPSCGKSAFVNSLLQTSGIRLADDSRDVATIPRYIINDSEQENFTLRGESCWGGTFDIPIDDYRNLSYNILDTFLFNPDKIIRGITASTSAPDELFQHLCIMDVPVRTASESDAGEDRNPAEEIVGKADLLIWLVDANSEDGIPESDLEFLSSLPFNHEHGIPLLLVAHKTNDEPIEHVELMLDVLEGNLRDAGLHYEGVCLYDSGNGGNTVAFREKNIHDFLKEHNQPVRHYYRFIVALYDAFRPYIDAIRSDCDKQDAAHAFAQALLRDARQNGPSGTDGNKELEDGLNDFLRHFQGAESREIRLSRAVDIRSRFSQCLREFCDGLVAVSEEAPDQKTSRKRNEAGEPPLCRKTSSQDDAKTSYELGEKYRTGDGVSQSYAKARRYYDKAAGQGDARAMFALGEIYYTGQGVPQDYDTALQWYIKSADYGYTPGCVRLGSLYESGGSVPRDYDKSRRWYKKAADQWYEEAEEGDAEAACCLGILHENGYGVPQDYDKAMKWYLKAAELGSEKAQLIIGNLYERGLGVPQDYGKAIEWYTKAAELGNDIAMFFIGTLHDDGKGVPQSYANALKWYTKAAERGSAEAQYELGNMHNSGRGTPKNGVEAIVWYEKAAEQGLAEAQCALGELYDDGDNGVPKDDAKASYWYKKAAEQGYARAQYYLAFQYRDGDGVPKNVPRYVYWHRKAAEQGYAPAQNYLGEMYENGRGVPIDRARACYWYKRAAAQGNGSALFNLGLSYQYGTLGLPEDQDKANELFQKAAEQGSLGAQLKLAGKLPSQILYPK